MILTTGGIGEEGWMSTVSKGAGTPAIVASEGSDSNEYEGAASAKEQGDEGVVVVEEEGLELGLSLGGGVQQRPRILTAVEFDSKPKLKSRPVSSASSVSSSSASPAVAEKTKPGTSGQVVVGWPPIGAYRINSLVNQSRGNALDSSKKNFSTSSSSNNSSLHKSSVTKDPAKKVASFFVKVNMDGDLIGRKVDITAHHSYTSLALALEDMFLKPNLSLTTSSYGTKAPRLLGGSSEFTLTYEDKDGDWMLVGDVPWRMFINTVKRLRIMRTSDANGLTPRC